MISACGGSEDDGGSKCTQADQYCNTDDRNGMRCKNGEWVKWTCGEGTTCSRADDGYLSCVSVSGEDGGIPQEDAGHDAGISDAGIDDAGMDDPDAGPTQDDGFVSIPAGSFTLSHDSYLHSSGTAVTISAFKLGKTPVTLAEFEKCAAAGKGSAENYTAYDESSSSTKYCNYNNQQNSKNDPMNCVNLEGALEYCEWIGGRLPTDEEWEYAATHNGTEHLNTTYSFGNTLQHCVNAAYHDADSQTYCSGFSEVDSYPGTMPVGTYSPAGDSPLGLVDMAGNVWEWTDAWSPTLKGGS